MDPDPTPLPSFKALVDDGKPPSLWSRLKWRVEESIILNLPRPVYRSWYRLSQWWHANITCRLWPRQAWLTKQVSKTWTDKVNLVPSLLYALVIHFVEEEKCFEVNDWAASGSAEQEDQLREVYQWAKTGRAAMEEQLQASYPPLSPIRWKPVEGEGFEGYVEMVTDSNEEPYHICYAEVNRLEALIEETDTKHLTTIVKCRGMMWT